MKKSLTLMALIAMLACERSIITDPSSTSNPTPTAQIISQEDQVGQFVYNQIRLHSDVDPYSYVSSDQAKALKTTFADLRTSGIKDPNLALSNASKSARISATMNTHLRQFNTNTLEYFAKLQAVDIPTIDNWFSNQLKAIQARSDISQDDQANLLIIQSAVRYAIKARLESISMPYVNESKNARAMSIDWGCIASEAQCVANTILTYAGYGATIGGIASPPATAPGTIVGVIVGSLVSIGTCQCQANTQPCQYPTRLVIPPQCLASGNNLQVRLAGYGENPNGFELEVWDTPDRQVRLTAPLQDASQGNVFYLQASTLQDRQKVYMRPVTNCGTGDLKYSPAMVEVDLVKLAQPQAAIVGQTDVSVSSTPITYSIVGAGFTTNSWSIFNTSVGTIVSQNPSSVQVQWTRPIGSPNAVYAYPNNDCTAGNNVISLMVTVHE